MKEKKKSHLGLILLVSILLLICAGMGTFIFVNKDKLMLKENTTTSKDEKKETSTTTEKENNNDLFKSETIHSYYYETKQEGTIKYFMTLGNMSNDNNNSGYFTIRYVSVYDSGSEAPLAAGYYDIEDGKLKLSVGPYTNTNKEEESEAVFKKLSANLEVDTEQYWIIAPNTPSYYKTYLTSYNENKLTIGNKTFYRVK